MIAPAWDAAVVGSGLGGLVAAAVLSGEGWKVLVLEAEGHPGGTAATYRRSGFRFPMGPLGFSSPGTVGEVWEGLCGEPLETRRTSYLLHAFGLDIEISSPFDRLEERLREAFPREGSGIAGFFATIRETTEALRSSNGRDFSDIERRAFSTPARDALQDLVDDWRLRRILGSQGCREPYSSLALLSAMWDLLCEQGIHYPRGGFDRVSEGLVETLRNNSPGGDIALGKRVAGIVLEDGRAAGLELEGGGRVRAGAVICNADFRHTFMEMLPAQLVPPSWLEALASAPLSSSVLQVALGLDTSRTDLSIFRRGSRVILCPEGGCRENTGEGAATGRPQEVSGSEMELCLLSEDDPALAPGGGAVLVIRTSADYRLFERFRISRGRRTPGYRDHKARLGDALVDEASRLIPGLREAVLEMDVATPLTFADRAGRSEGAVAGWSWEFTKEMGAWRELVRTPVAGLYMCGHQAFSSLLRGGVPSAMLSGREAALAALLGDPPAKEPPFLMRG